MAVVHARFRRVRRGSLVGCPPHDDRYLALLGRSSCLSPALADCTGARPRGQTQGRPAGARKCDIRLSFHTCNESGGGCTTVAAVTLLAVKPGEGFETTVHPALGFPALGHGTHKGPEPVLLVRSIQVLYLHA